MKISQVLTAVILLLTLISSSAVHAQRLVVWQKDGNKVSYDLDVQPKTTFTTDELIITTTKTKISFPLSQIQRYTYEDIGVSVNDVKAKGINISHRNDLVVVKGLAKGKSVIVYSIDGKQLIAKRSDGSEHLMLSLSKLSAGVYMIKADEVTYKFSK